MSQSMPWGGPAPMARLVEDGTMGANKGTNVPWSWVGQPPSARPKAKGPGGYHRPPSLRDVVLAQAFGDLVKQHRERRGLSSYQLAELLAISQPSLSQIENHDRVDLTVRQLFDVAEALLLDPVDLFRALNKASTRMHERLVRRNS